MAKGWAARWRAAGWTTAEGRPTAHAELWEAILELCSVRDVEFVWLPAEGIPEYAVCQRLARAVVREQVRRIAESRAEAVAARDPAGARRPRKS
jgi:ribonuclease HI